VGNRWLQADEKLDHEIKKKMDSARGQKVTIDASRANSSLADGLKRQEVWGPVSACSRCDVDGRILLPLTGESRRRKMVVRDVWLCALPDSGSLHVLSFRGTVAENRSDAPAAPNIP
jgi:hypothetical protein